MRRRQSPFTTKATGVDKSVITTSTGNWTVPFLDPGIYDVRVEASKFKSIDKTNITLSTGETAEVNFTLVPGSATETVTVNASEDVLDYDKADVGNVLENHLLQQLPDFDNDTFNFAIFTPGMMTTTTGLAPGNQSAQTFTIHGASVEFSIDGVANISETGPEHYTMAPPFRFPAGIQDHNQPGGCGQWPCPQRSDRYDLEDRHKESAWRRL